VAYLMTHFWPGGTEEQYRAQVAAVHPPAGLPDGQLYHAAGPTDGGFLIAVVWDAKENADRFVSDTLMASMPVEGGFQARQPEAHTAEVSNLQTASNLQTT
jgi:selenophosphate synthase